MTTNFGNINFNKAKNPEDKDIDSPENFSPILDEDKRVITYSNSITIALTKHCHNQCEYCDFPDIGGPLMVPYHTIKCFKKARLRKAREVNIVAGERPDTINLIRTKLDTWGFESYSEYVYTICELAFLEGLLPHLNIGYLTPKELRYLREISVSMEMNLETTNRNLLESIHQNSPGKDPDIRVKFIESCGKLEIPVTTGLRVGMGETEDNRIETLTIIKKINEQYGHIQDVVLHNYIPRRRFVNQLQPTTEELMLSTVKLAREILPKEIKIRVPIILNQNIIKFIDAGVDDLGEIQPGESSLLFPGNKYPKIEELAVLLETNGYKLDRRLPIYYDFIINQKYSKKLAQLLDKYRYKLNLSLQEKENNKGIADMDAIDSSIEEEENEEALTVEKTAAIKLVENILENDHLDDDDENPFDEKIEEE
ncbi:MAG: 7,8-didemethyl-8-hydroxy-5-deazariboflavin synthase subunit CofG [Candidatus Margulisiibacteriota bacterium]|nr:MAG: 7,8-didemethyl-8-hydroxy-5-deazariboflavin synthase subunit CofG [Candidatus Margulisbacteria bacterium GWD2_39_127]OGI03126.1 MAG: 7,8-didemethyl-8-hydroxy-5-deazariboflavin synthase subunit CofG [Candidatus Margulisbacteria bacterium GWF2_38_17]OGI11671.1 MAG: 7,8-didemethyl-8-hydroxy-5-deazariboflavin synthase subunit CofG [Candidatus Margulisbacteria bacterium GWE2_39_32]PZM83783.1 MAG: 7,8-didemethyl-8-hydroxy-5-deazariboflavin synthase subunit CofG [Candidatus Margulisiibacteriota 